MIANEADEIKIFEFCVDFVPPAGLEPGQKKSKSEDGKPTE